MDKMDKGRSLAQEIRLWVAENPGRKFGLSTLDNELGIWSTVDKNNRWHIIRRLVEEGLVEKYGGGYRVIVDGLVTLNWRAADESLIWDIKWPFGLENYVDILPKNIIVVAGSKDAGKTAFLLNVVRLNMDKYTIHYYSSEMGELELKRRLRKFEDTGLAKMDSWKFYTYEKSFDFQDAVSKNPNDIHIIDFLEIHKDFWEVSGLIYHIWDKLGGIAIIALQKNPGADMGLGGGRSLEKARLYLTMDINKLTIKVGKNWAQETVNPRGKSWTFQLVGGAKFLNIQEAND